MTYLGEIRINWRYLAAATIGLASGHMLNHYLNGIFAPHLIAEFGWTRSEYALIGLTILIGTISMPIAGRLTDLFGARPMATAGVVIGPLLFILFSMQGGSFAYFFLLNVLQLMLVGSTTTSMVYSRLIAERFSRARGFALSISASAPAATVAVVTPLLSAFIEEHGWRTGYIAVAVAVAIGGAAAIFLIPPRGGNEPSVARTGGRSVKRDYPMILRSPVFRILIAGKFLCTMTTMVQASQLKLVFLDKGLSSVTASWLLSLYAIGIAIGRLCSGIALDRWRAHIIAAIVFGVPGIGLCIIGTNVSDPVWLAAAVMIVGISSGAELDVAAYLVMRFFRVEIYSTVYSLTQVIIAFSAASGTLLLSATLKISGGFGLFYMLAAGITLVGSLCFLLLGRYHPVEE